MIDDLDGTLSTLLRRELPSVLSEQVQVCFATPDDQFPPQSVTLPAIDLFLYDIRENLELRENEPVYERVDGRSATRTPAPVRVDFSYLITAWPSESVPDPAQDEHRMLSEVMKVLVRHPMLPNELLQGGLDDQRLPLPATTLRPGPLQSIAEFWQAMGGKPKATLNCTVTLAVPRGAPEGVELVTDKLIRLRSEQESST